MSTYYILALILMLLYVIISILSLCDTSYDESHNICATSNLWSYVLSSLITLILMITIFRLTLETGYWIPLVYFLYGPLGLGFLIWGFSEYRHKCVDDLSDTLLYNIGIATMTLWLLEVIITMFVTSLTFLHHLQEGYRQAR